MHIYNYNIPKNTSVNRWWISEIDAVAYTSETAVFDGEINYTEGYVDRVYPVRRSFLQEDRIDTIRIDDVDSREMKRLYLPFGNNRIEGTDFYHNPMYLSFVGETYLFVEEACTLNFDLYTCGGVKLWLDRTLIETFAPYTRNRSSKISIQLKLSKGLNKLSAYADDLAERDVQFHFELRYMGNLPLVGIIQLEESAERVKAAESFLSNCHFDRDIYNTGKIMLTCVQGILQDSIQATILGKNNMTSSFQTDETTVGPRSREIFIGEVTNWPVGFYRITLKLKLDEVAISRQFVVGSYPEHMKHTPKGHSISYRKKSALESMAACSSDDCHGVLARFATKGEMTSDIEYMLNNILTKVEVRDDLSVTYLGLLLLIHDRFSDVFEPTYTNRIISAITNYSYWCDEPGNDVMWFFSETHALHFHIAQFLSGSIFEEEIFTTSGRQGVEQAKLGKSRLMDWFEHFFENGYGDWNAITHMPMNILGFLYLYELSSDKQIRESALQCLDFTFRQITYHSFKGLMSATFGRAYDEQLKGREMTEAAYLSWITNGEGYINNNIRTAEVYAFSSYEPEDMAFEVAVEPGEGVIIELNQGVKSRAIYSYKTSAYMMSSTQNFPAFIPGHQQHLMNIALGSGVQCYINHPGERSVSGAGHPSYWAGNGSTPLIRQYRNVMLIRYQIPESALVHYIHMYLPSADFDEIIIKDQNLYARSKDGYLAVRFSHPISWQEYGPTAGKEVICKGRQNFVYMKCCEARQWQDFESFVIAMEAMGIEYSLDQSLRVDDLEYGIIEMDADGQLKASGIPVPLYMANEVLIERTRLKKIN